MKLFRQTVSFLLAFVMLFGASLAAESKTTPFKEHKLPGIVHFCDVDRGGPGISHSALSGIDGKYQYRDDIQLNFYADKIGAIVGASGTHWYIHTVEATKAGVYAISVRAASPSVSHYDIEIDGVLVGGADATPGGSYQSVTDSLITEIELSAGVHVIKTTQTMGSANLHSLIFQYLGEKSNVDLKPTKGAYRQHYLPTRIEGEDFDIDGYISLDGVNNPEKYRKDAAIDIDETQEDKRLYVFCNKGEAVSYTFQVEESGAYQLSASAIYDGQVTILIDGVKIASKKDIRADGPSSENKLVNIWLPKGTHTMQAVCENENFAIDYFEFEANREESVTLDENSSQTQTEISNNIYRTIYVSTKGDDENDGSKTSPFASLKRAIEEVSKINKDMTGDIVVEVDSGSYYIDEKLTIDEKAGGQNGYRVIYKGKDLFNTPVIHGGKQITGWQPQDNSPIWVAQAAHVEDTRTLYINDASATIARSRYKYQASHEYKVAGSPYVSDGMVVSLTNFPKSFKNPQDLMLGWNLLWTTQRSAVDDVIFDDKTATLVMKQPEWNCYSYYAGRNTLVGVSKEFYLENALELLDEPGEFYFDKTDKKIYYYPYENEDLRTAETYVATTEKLLYIGGSSIHNKLSNVELNNLSFKYGAWNEVSETGLRINQTDNQFITNEKGTWYTEVMLPAQITLNNAENTVIQNCRFACLGSNGLNIDNGVQNAKIIGNVFHDIAGTGIVVGHYLHTDYLDDSEERVENIEVANNVIRRPAQEILGCTAISLYYPKNVQVHHNDIKDTPYSAIVAGWGWGSINGDVKENRDIRITHNRIENVTQTLVDGAHIYTLGKMENSYISNNYLIDAKDHRGGIYLDEGTKAVTVENNVVTKSYCFLFARTGVKISSNHARNNYTDSVIDRAEEEACTEENTVRVSGNNWPQEARKIMEEAGLQTQYKHLLNGVENPDWREPNYKRFPKSIFQSEEIYEVNKWILGRDYSDFYEISGIKPDVYGGGEIGDTRPGEWVEWTAKIPETATYKLFIRGGDGWAKDEVPCTAKVELDGEVVDDAVLIPRDNWKLTDIEVGNVELTAGIHKIRITVQGIDWLVGGFKLESEFLLKDASDYEEGKIISEAEMKDRLYGFLDIDGHWAAYEIRTLADAGVIRGYDKHTFGPEDTVTLHQACLLALRALDENTDGDWKKIATEKGMLQSDDEEDAPISRERFADIVMKVYSDVYTKYQITVDGSSYDDIAEAELGYMNAIYGAKEQGFLTGYPDNTFCPKKTLTRAEAAKVILSLSEKI